MVRGLNYPPCGTNGAKQNLNFNLCRYQMNLKEEIQQKFNLSEDHFSRHESDLYILPANASQSKLIEAFLKESKISFCLAYSDVKGQTWYGKKFIEVPFMA